jgi:hypothetical protein
MAITKIQAGALPADVITTAAIDDASITHAKLHTTMDLSGKTVTLPSLSQTIVNSSHIQMGGNLDVVGQIGAYNNPGSSWGKMILRAADFEFKNAGSTIKMVLDTSGNVGIGTTSPGTTLHVYNSTTNGVATFESGDAQGGIALKDNSTTQSVYLLADGNDFKVQTNTAEVMRIHSEGYTELKSSDAYNQLVLTPSGTNAPASINFNTPGTGRAKIKVQDAEFISILPTGNVGIGTTTPSAELDVDGDIRGNSFNGVSTGTRNLLINGDMQIAQRSTNAVLSSNAYQYAALDRWGNYYTGNQIQRTSVDIAAAGGGTPNKNAMRITRASSNGHLYTFQFLEGLGRLLRINTPFSVSFKARASKSGSAVVQMRYGNSGAASTAADNDIDGSVSLTTSWQTFKYDNLTHNRDYTNAGIWLWGIDSNFAAVGDWIEITDFQLELGPKCTPYEQKTEGMEFLACMRYYQKLDAIHLSGSSSGDHGIFMGHVWGAGIIYFVHHFNVPMRTGPTLKLGQSQATTGNWFSAGSVVQTGSLMRIQSANQYKAEMSSSLAQSSFTPGNSCWMRLYNSSAWLAFDAEI